MLANRGHDLVIEVVNEFLRFLFEAFCRFGHGSAELPVDEALAHVALEASGRPLLVSKVDLSEARIAGLAGDLAARFLDELAQTAGLTLHVRLVEGSDSQHVLEAIFKALGVALAQALTPRRREEA